MESLLSCCLVRKTSSNSQISSQLFYFTGSVAAFLGWGDSLLIIPGVMKYVQPKQFTPLEPKNEGLEDAFPFQRGYFQVPC